jgi:hypothetical protein
MSSPSSLIDLMNSSLSKVENWLRNPAISAGLGDFTVAMVVVSLSLVVVAWAHGFWYKQFHVRCPCLPHSKHWPSFLHFSFSASVVAVKVPLHVKIFKPLQTSILPSQTLDSIIDPFASSSHDYACDSSPYNQDVLREAQPYSLVISTAMLSKYLFIPWEIPWGFPHDPRSIISIYP